MIAYLRHELDLLLVVSFYLRTKIVSRLADISYLTQIVKSTLFQACLQQLGLCACPLDHDVLVLELLREQLDLFLRLL